MARVERWIVYPVLGLLCWAAFGGAVPVPSAQAGDKDARFATVQAGRFEVIDKQGKTVAVLGANEQGGGALIVLTAEQRPVVELGVRRKAGALTLMRHAEKPEPMVQIAADQEGRGQLAIFVEQPGAAALVLGRNDNGGIVSIRSNQGRPAAGMTVSPTGTGFCAVTAGDDGAKAFLGVTERGGLVGVKNMQGRPRVMIHVGEAGGVVTVHKPAEAEPEKDAPKEDK